MMRLHAGQIDWRPETIASMRARFHRAIEDSYDDEAVKLCLQTQPGRQRKHVFDFEDGIRLVISVSEGRCTVSASFGYGTPGTIPQFERVTARLDSICDVPHPPLKIIGLIAGRSVAVYETEIRLEPEPARAGQVV